jgi:hypothetical protein
VSGSDRTKSNRNLRALINVYVQGCTPGTKIKTYRLVRQFPNKNRCLTPQRISMLLRDKENLQHTGRNEWTVIE